VSVTPAPIPAAFLTEVAGIVGDAHVVRDPDRVASHTTDWTGRFTGATPAVVLPGSTAEVAGVVAACGRHGVALVPQGGNTGLVGGGVPLGGEVVLNLRRLDWLDPVDNAARAVTVGAGATLGALQDHARAAGLAYAVDLAARDSATVGGTIATNAGGLHVLRWGATRAQLLGIEAVLGDGSVVSHLAGLTKDNTGYDLAGLLCGSEGTLGVITAARLRLIPELPERTVALVGMTSVDAAVDAAGRWAVAVAGVDAIELFLRSGLELVCDATGTPDPLARPWPAYLLVEVSAHSDPTDHLAGVVAATAGVGDVAVGRTEAERARLWSYREAHTEAINRLGAPHKLDVSLPHNELAHFMATVGDTVAAVAPGAATWLFGHAGDGNVHVNVTGVAPGDEAVDDAVLRQVAGLGGSISAEHGIGTAKKAWLALNRSPAELAAFRSVRRALDPHGILNPAVLTPPTGRELAR
jgi:FAD/FMN-containing dehydrogenase